MFMKVNWEIDSMASRHNFNQFCIKNLRPWCPLRKVAQMVKNLPALQETRVWSLGRKDPLEKGMATHSRILAWTIPWTEEPGGLQSMKSQRIGHDWVTNFKNFTGKSYIYDQDCYFGSSYLIWFSSLYPIIPVKCNGLKNQTIIFQSCEEY